MALSKNKARGQVAKRRQEFNAKSRASHTETFHRCSRCGATEVSHPDRDFRVTGDDEETCSECL